jgi:hypothetical protein
LVPPTEGIGCGLLPTPTVTDGSSNFAWKLRKDQTWETAGLLGGRLNGLIFGMSGRQPGTVRAKAHPEFVEWMMGFPTTWTDCGGSGTPSSRPSPS